MEQNSGRKADTTLEMQDRNCKDAQGDGEKAVNKHGIVEKTVSNRTCTAHQSYHEQQQFEISAFIIVRV